MSLFLSTSYPHESLGATLMQEYVAKLKAHQKDAEKPETPR